MNVPDLPLPLSPSQSSANLLLDFSGGKQHDPHGRDLIEEHSFSHKSSMLSQNLDLSELTPSRTGKNSITKKMSEYASQIDPKKSSRMVLGSSEYDNPGESRNLDFAPENRIIRKPTKGGIGSESRMDLLSPLKSPLTTTSKRASSRKSRASFLSDWRNSESQPKRASSQSGMSIFALLAMARKMGLIKKTHAYDDYMSQEQFNMIKDFSTGKFDKKEEKRTEQMERLKKKLLLDSHKALRTKTKSHKKKKYLSDWKESLIPTLKLMHHEFRQRISQVIAPNGMFRVVWDLYTMILIFYDLTLLPLILSFDVVIPSSLEVIDIAIAASFLADIIMNFNTGFYEKGMLVMDRRRITINYLKGWFWTDLLASFPYEYAFKDNETSDDVSGAGSYQFIRVAKALRFIKILRFVRVFKLKNLFLKLESYIDLSATVTSIIGFLKLTLITLFIAHWIGCAWHYLSVWELEYHPQTWLTESGMVDMPWTDRYVSSIYWATTTMITVGYGDIIPITRNEKILAVIAMLVASAIFAYTMNRINVIMAGLETTSEQYQKALATITGYMRKKHVKKELQIKIKKYLEYALEVETSLDSNEDCLNAFLNQSLKNELLLEIHGKVLIENPIFGRFDNSLILKAALNLKEKIFSPEDPVFLEDDHDDCSFYIIHSGKVEIFNFKSHSFLKTLTKGSYFGEISFFTGHARSASVRSTDFSALYLVKRSDFLELLNEFPEDKEKFHEVKDRLSIYQDQSVISLKCFSCGSSEHIVNECPKVHAVVPKAKLLQTYMTRRGRFMSSYIRSGERGNKNPDRYSVIAHAAKRIQVQMWEGDLEVDKALLYVNSNIDLPEFSEHPWEMFHEENKKRKIPSFNQGEAASARRKRSSIENKMLRPPGSQTLSSLDVDSGKSGSSGNILGSKQELKKKKKKQKQKASSAVISVPANKTKQDKKKDAVENDIDKIENYKYYFPHNNFEELFPPPLENKKTMNFDYFSHSDTTKDTLKRFINILKERVRIRKENEAKEKGRKNASFFKFGRSKFYKERSMSNSSKHGKAPSPGVGSPVSTPKTPKTPNAPKSAKLRKDGEARFDLRFDNDSDNSRSDSEF